MQKKSKYVGIRCTPSAFDLLHDIASQRNTTLSELTRKFYCDLISEHLNEIKEGLGGDTCEQTLPINHDDQ